MYYMTTVSAMYRVLLVTSVIYSRVFIIPFMSKLNGWINGW